MVACGTIRLIDDDFAYLIRDFEDDEIHYQNKKVGPYEFISKDLSVISSVIECAFSDFFPTQSERNKLMKKN